MIERVVVLIAAYLIVLVQIGVFGAWPLLGGQPNLIALGAAAFLVLQRPVLGLWWVVCGGLLIDLLLPVRFGTTLLPLLIGYGVSSVLLRFAIDAGGWWSTVFIGLCLLVITQLPLTILTQSWQQLGKDFIAGCIILLPMGIVLNGMLAPVRSGLRISRQ